MSQTFNGREILQVSKAQCEVCGSRLVFSVLVAGANRVAGRKWDRAFYMCDRAMLSRHYVPHDCQSESKRAGGRVKALATSLTYGSTRIRPDIAAVRTP